MNPPHPFLHLHRRQTLSDLTTDTSIPQSSTNSNNNSNNNNNNPSFYHPHQSSTSSIYLTPIVADRNIITPRTASTSFSSEQQHHQPSTPSLPFTTTITPLFRPTPPPTYNRVSAVIAAATLSAITASSAESDAAVAVRKSSPSPACEECMASTSESCRQRAVSPCSTHPPSLRHQQQQAAAAITHSSVITPEFDIVHHPIRDTVWIVSALLSLMAHKNDGQYNPLVDPITPFHSRAVPRISIEAYLTRILQFIPFTNEVLLNLLVFLDRIGGLDGMDNEIVGLAEGCGAGRGGSSNRVDSSLQKNGLAADAVVASSSSQPHSPSSHSSTISSFDTITSSSSFSTGTAITSATQIATAAAAVLPGSSSGQAQSSSCHTSRHTQRVRSMSSSSSSSRVESSFCSRTSFSVSARIEADPEYFPPSIVSPTTSSSSSTASCIHPINNSNNNNNSINNNSNLNFDSPMVHKRGREAEIHEYELQRVGGGPGGGSKDSEESSTSSFSSSSTSPSSFSSSSTATTSLHLASTHQHAPPPPLFHDGDNNRDAEHSAKRARFQDPVATERVITSSNTMDAHITPGGATPAPTPKMTVTPNGFRINSFNIHRLLITCLMVAAKFTSDLFYSNARYAKVGGLSLPELNQLELVFLFTTQFDLNVKEEELQRVGNALLRFKNREATTLVSQVPLPAPPTAIAAQVARTVVVVGGGTTHPNTINTAANSNAVNNDGYLTLKNNATATTESSSETVVDSRQQPSRAGRFSIPSPTSPKSGPMSDRGFPQKPIPSLPSSSSLSSSLTSTVSSTAIATFHTVSNSAGHSIAVVASGSHSQPPQLLSPPEERCGEWAKGGAAGDARDVHMATPAPTPSALSSSMSTGPN